MILEDPYELVAIELRNGVRHDGLWLRSFAESGGDESRAWSIYARLRAQEYASLILEEKAQAKADAKRREEEARRELAKREEVAKREAERRRRDEKWQADIRSQLWWDEHTWKIWVGVLWSGVIIFFLVRVAEQLF